MMKRWIIFSDIHSNLEALEVFVEYVKKEEESKLIFLGDAIGYGPNPNEVIEILRQINVSFYCAGNHDWALIEKFPLTYFNPYARIAIEWTKKVINKRNLNFLHTFGLRYRTEEFLCVHASPYQPHRFHYILNSDEAFFNFDFFSEKICFIGHTHFPEVYVLESNRIQRFVKVDTIEIKDFARYIVNVGSVGQPRDGDPRICFCVYDTNKRVVEFKRIEYNIKGTQRKIIRKGLPSFLASRLQKGM